MARQSSNEKTKDRKHGGVITTLEKGRLYQIDITVNGQRIRERFRGNKTEAVEHVDELRKAAQAGVRIDCRRVTYAAYSNDYLTALENSPNIRSTTARQYRTIEKHIVGNPLGSKRIVDITPQDINHLYSDLRKSGVGETTICQVHAQIKRILSAAVDDRIIVFSPCNRTVVAPVLPEPDRRSLSREEASRLCELLLMSEPNACSLAALIALATGLRIGEILGLTWENTHIECDYPHFNVIQQRTKEGLVTERKTSKAGRKPNPYVPIDPQLEKVLLVWREYQRRMLLENGRIELDPTTPVCSNTLGTWSDSYNISKAFRRFCVKNGFGQWISDEGKPIVEALITDTAALDSIPDDAIVEYIDAEGWPVDSEGHRYSRTRKKPKVRRHYRGLKFHELRKTCFTLRLDGGESIKTLQAHGGWFTPRMLLERYATPVDDSVRNAPMFLESLSDAKNRQTETV